jgi:hypothetical protein
MSLKISKLIITLLIATLLAACTSRNSYTAVNENGFKVGVYYYIWWGLPSPYINHWKEGVKYTPLLGEYDSGNSSVADKHIILAKQHGINFFSVSWLGTWDWYDHRHINDNLKNGLLKAKHLETFKFCLFYESVIVLNAALQANENFTRIFLEDINYAAENYFIHPSYLKIDGKPVLFIYNLPYIYNTLGTTTTQNFFTALRKQINLYLIGDLGGEPIPPNTGSYLFNSLDAVTNYFFSNPTKNWNKILTEAEEYYPKWRLTTESIGIKFIPNAYPGFDTTKHFEQGIELTPSETMFERMLTTAFNYADKDLKTVMITSWNEWLESTAIEPSMERGETFLHTVFKVKQSFNTQDHLKIDTGNRKEKEPYSTSWSFIYLVFGFLLGSVASLITFKIIKTRSNLICYGNFITHLKETILKCEKKPLGVCENLAIKLYGISSSLRCSLSKTRRTLY